MTTYDFITNRKVMPKQRSPPNNCSTVKPTSDERLDHEAQENEVSPHKNQPEIQASDRNPAPVDAKRKNTEKVGNGLKSTKNSSEAEILRHPLSHQVTQRFDMPAGKDAIIKPK